MMKVRLILIILIGLVAAAGSYFFLSSSAQPLERLIKTDYLNWRTGQKQCQQIPLPYSLGQIDEKFDLTEAEIIELVDQAKAIWEEALGQELFYYQTDADGVVINFIFDHRQAQVLSEKQITEELTGRWSDYEQRLADYHRQLNDYSIQVAAFNHLSQDYNNQVAAFNTTLADFGRRPIPKDRYQEFKQQEQNLAELLSRLKTWRADLEQSAEQLKQISLTLQSLYNQLVRQIDIHNQIFSQSTQTIAGESYRYTINVYQFRSRTELIALLAHELAHALGADHVKNPQAILYHQLKEQNFHDLKPTAEDLAEIRRVCRL